MTERKLSCIVFMPFRPDLTFVYDLGIRPALERVSQERPHFVFTPERADEKLVIDDDKVRKIIDSLVRSDLVVADITGHNPSVLWELGFSHALEKPVIILSQSTGDLPFNIRTRDVLHYDFSVDGMERLRVDLARKLLPIMDEMVVSLRYDEEIDKLNRSINRGLAHLERDSILRNFVKNEMIRLERRVSSLQAGQFDLRNEKPNKEIIRYFCDYVAQLDSQDCSYDTISIRDFWTEITDEATDFEYLTANIHAAERGAHIRRVFLVDAKQFPGKNVSRDPQFRLILSEHYLKTLSFGEQIETKIYFTENYATDVKTYKNLAIWKRGPETMLFIPGYRRADNRMAETLFTYFHDNKSEASGLRGNKTEIDKHKTHFREVWSRGETVSPGHFQEPGNR